MRSSHIPEHIVLKLTMEDRNNLIKLIHRSTHPSNYTFTDRLKLALFEGREKELAENRELP